MGGRYVDEEVIRRWITDAASNSSPGSSYLVYNVYAGQSATDPPTVDAADVFQNTIGAIVWTRNNIGDYHGTLNGAFPSGKTVIRPFDTNSVTYLPLSGVTLFDAGYVIGRLNDNTIFINSFLADFTPVELSTIIGGSKIPILVEIWP